MVKMEKEKQNKIQKEVSFENEKKEWFSDRTGKIILGISVVLLVSIAIFIRLILVYLMLFIVHFSMAHPGHPPSPCLDAFSQIQIKDIGTTCIRKTDNLISFEIKSGPGDFELSRIEVMFSKSGIVYTYNISNTNKDIFTNREMTNLATLEDLLRKNEEKIYYFKGILADEISIRPIIKLELKNKTYDKECDVGSIKRLRYCHE